MNEIPFHEPIFIDTWGWLAFGHRRDNAHKIIKQIFNEIRNREIPIYTSDYILNELITILFRRENYNESVQFINGILTASNLHQLWIDRVTSERFASAWELRKEFEDKPKISFTDFTSMAIMKERKIQFILTGDKHFSQVGMEFSIIPENF